MGELTFLLILFSIGIVLLVAMFTYYKHHKKIRDEIEDFNHHANNLDDVLLDNAFEKSPHNNQSGHLNSDQIISSRTSDLIDQQLPKSFSASKSDNFNIDDVQLMDERSFINASSNSYSAEKNDADDELVDGVYLKSKRVIANPNPQRNPLKSYSKTTDTFNTHIKNTQTVQTIEMIYDKLPDAVEELIISHTILSKNGSFSGKELLKAIYTAGLLHGEMDIFHYPGDKKPQTYALFSLANLVEPGTFNLEEADSFSTPGVSLFMRLPSRIDNNDAYDKFIKVAIIIATELDAELCDEKRCRLTQQTVTHKKELIKKLNFQLMKAEKTMINAAKDSQR
ncbi:MAG: cell division protein ZipA [gamma proteobacterium symbiont of Taylorina sp.]|nr:cell division protein ZipA [gamma proteobacterium symbiont of Taylorina sp.]